MPGTTFSQSGRIGYALLVERRGPWPGPSMAAKT